MWKAELNGNHSPHLRPEEHWFVKNWAGIMCNWMSQGLSTISNDNALTLLETIKSVLEPTKHSFSLFLTASFTLVLSYLLLCEALAKLKHAGLFFIVVVVVTVGMHNERWSEASIKSNFFSSPFVCLSVENEHKSPMMCIQFIHYKAQDASVLFRRALSFALNANSILLHLLSIQK